MGFGSLANPYVENPFAGRITKVHWRSSEPAPLAATAHFDVDININGSIHPELQLHDLVLLSYTGTTLILTGGDIGDIEIKVSFSAGLWWSISIATEFHSGVLGSGGDLGIEVVQVASDFGIDRTAISQDWSGGDHSETTDAGGPSTEPLTFAVRGVMSNGSGYDFLSSELMISVSSTGPL